MPGRHAVLFAAALLVSGPLAAVADAGADRVAAPNAERRGELDTLLYQDCGSCHGMTLRGGLGPALEPERMRAYGEAALAALILEGVPGTAMPAWKALLSEADAGWLAEQLIHHNPLSAADDDDSPSPSPE